MSIIKTDNFTAEELKSMLCRGDLAISDLDITALYKLIDHETTRLCFGDGDIALIEECATLLAAKDEGAAVKGVFEKAADAYLPKGKTKRFGVKRAIVIAAAVVTLVIGGTVVASALGFSVYDFIAWIIMEPDGTEFEDSELTFYNAGEHKTYSSLKDAVEKENLNIMYPASLPEGVSVKELRVADSQTGDKRIYVFTENDEIIITVDTGVTSPEGAFDNQELYTKNGVSYIIYESTTEHKYGAYCNADNCDYIIQAKKHEDLIYIIENLVKPQGGENA